MEMITPEEALRQFHEWKQKQKEAQARYRAKNHDKIVERRRVYREAHIDEVRERNKEYMRASRQRKKETSVEKVNGGTDE
jgi:hypothetical protein